MDNITKTMIDKAQHALAHAYAPYSHFSVAACIGTDRGNLYTGVNVENASYGLSNCAESSAICAMVSAGEKRIKSIVILAGNDLLCPPCGACRQKIKEFSDEDTMVLLCNRNSVLRSLKIIDLLPLAFDFR